MDSLGLEKNSKILVIKSRFFLYRALCYFSFLLIPIWLQKSNSFNQSLNCLMMVFYIAFMVGQWFLLGKEIDYRLKIYFRINSSIDRVVYRMLLGMMFVVIYFNLLSFFPNKWIYNLFWVTWIILGLFYSWPTRGKIIRESVTSNFSEFKYLDSFEKTLLLLVILLFVFSIPEPPGLENNEALKLFFDPAEKYSSIFWNFLTVNYFPFKKYPDLFKLAWCMHYYFVGMGSCLLVFYALLRYFLSRRLSLLGVFLLISSWSYSKILATDYGAAIDSTYSVILVWSLLWVARSATYRAGLFLGLICLWGTLLDIWNLPIVVLQLVFLFLFFLRDKTYWFKRQLLKYSSFGLILTVIAVMMKFESFTGIGSWNIDLVSEFFRIINRKALFSLSIIGALILFLKYFFKNNKALSTLYLDTERVGLICISLASFAFFSLFLDIKIMKNFSVMWPLAFFSLIPIELLFQATSRLRSRRNMIYLVYIIICLLDSHFEGRVKIFLKLFG